jgi:hypothetical protein
MAKVGDRVLAQWPQEKDWWYPGVVVSDGGGAYEVQFDDGDRATLKEDQTLPLLVSAGDRVYCRWKGGPVYYPGEIANIIGAAIWIDYDDGDHEGTSISLIRVNEEDL